MDIQHDEEITIQALPDEFFGRGSTKKFEFTKIVDSDEAAIFKVHTGETVHYEVFKKQAQPICLDFAAHVYSETQYKYMYPKDNAFGKWAWTAGSPGRAAEIYKNIVNAVAIKAATDLGFIAQIQKEVADA